jgi:ferric-dicitrate binding protein FerR (iron transport regulator)
MSEAPRPEARVTALVGLLRAAVKPPSVFELDRGLAALRARSERRRAPSPLRSRATWLAVALAGVVLVALFGVGRSLRSSESDVPVAVARIKGGELLQGGYLSEVGGAGMSLAFNEGSEFVFMPGTRARLREVTAGGARVALEHGTASFRITPNVARRWSVEAGPFLVSVRGTDFTVVWNPTSETFSVKLRRGRVVVSGPIVGDELVLQSGQELAVDLHRHETVISEGHSEREADAAAPPAVASVGAAPPPSSAVVSPPLAQPPATASAAQPRRWRQAMASGQWDRILADVERDGVDASLRTLSSDELFALADAARYRRRPELARAALLAQRERFPTSPRALDAIFLLGRVEESRGLKTLAIERYDEYLARASAGTYAAEALGRKMILLKDVEGPANARHLADEYLARFPAGSYAEAARTLQRAP